jgi:hypothetical protein
MVNPIIPFNVGKTMPFLPPMTGNEWFITIYNTYKNCDFPGGWWVQMALVYPHGSFVEDVFQGIALHHLRFFFQK